MLCDESGDSSSVLYRIAFIAISDLVLICAILWQWLLMKSWLLALVASGVFLAVVWFWRFKQQMSSNIERQYKSRNKADGNYRHQVGSDSLTCLPGYFVAGQPYGQLDGTKTLVCARNTSASFPVLVWLFPAWLAAAPARQNCIINPGCAMLNTRSWRDGIACTSLVQLGRRSMENKMRRCFRGP